MWRIIIGSALMVGVLLLLAFAGAHGAGGGERADQSKGAVILAILVCIFSVKLILSGIDDLDD